MKKQTFVAIIKDASGKELTFERFSCKRSGTVKTGMMKLLENDLYRACVKGAATVEVYSTPDGYNREKNSVLMFTV